MLERIVILDIRKRDGFVDLILSTTLLIASPESDFSIQNLKSKTATVVGFIVVSSQIGQSHPLVWLIEIEWM